MTKAERIYLDSLILARRRLHLSGCRNQTDAWVMNKLNEEIKDIITYGKEDY